MTTQTTTRTPSRVIKLGRARLRPTLFKELMTNAGLRYEDLAKLTNIPKGSLLRLGSDPDATTTEQRAKAIALVLGVSVPVLFETHAPIVGVPASHEG